MSRKSAILALAAVASLGSVALSSSHAMAFGRGGGMHFAALRVGHPSFVIGHLRGPHWYPHHDWHFGWRRPYWIAPVVATAAYSAAPSWNRCNCLTKEYTPEGAVVFKDMCTNESAINPPANGPTTGDASEPQPPTNQSYSQPSQQQGYLQPQQQGYLQPTQTR